MTNEIKVERILTNKYKHKGKPLREMSTIRMLEDLIYNYQVISWEYIKSEEEVRQRKKKK